MIFQERLKEIRKARNISIRRLCVDLKIGKSTYGNWKTSFHPDRSFTESSLNTAVEAVLLRYGLFKEIVDVSTNLQTSCATN